MRKHLQIILLLSLLVPSLSACGMANEASDAQSAGNTPAVTEESNAVCAYVDGEAVVKAEVDYFAGRLRGRILSDYTEKYGITDFSDFWNTEYDDTTPADELESEALTAAVRAKAELIEMRKRGIYDEISFDAFMEQALAYNKGREESPQSAGISSIDMSPFYTYYISNGEITLCEDAEIAADFEKFVDGLVANSEVVLVAG